MSFYGRGDFGGAFEDIVVTISNMIKTRKIMKAPILNSRRGLITEFRIPSKVRIGDWHEVSAIYKGSVKSGYFSLMIQDRDGVKEWFRDDNSMDHKILDSGQSVETGVLNFSNGLYESKWKFRPERPLYAGSATAVIHMFEDTNLYPLTFQEKKYTYTNCFRVKFCKAYLYAFKFCSNCYKSYWLSLIATDLIVVLEKNKITLEIRNKLLKKGLSLIGMSDKEIIFRKSISVAN